MSKRHFETMSAFIPDTTRVREAYVASETDKAKYVNADEDAPLPQEADAEFDRFIAKVKADALREVADDLYGGTPNIPCTQGSVNRSIRVHADRIEGEA